MSLRSNKDLKQDERMASKHKYIILLSEWIRKTGYKYFTSHVAGNKVKRKYKAHRNEKKQQQKTVLCQKFTVMNKNKETMATENKNNHNKQ